MEEYLESLQSQDLMANVGQQMDLSVKTAEMVWWIKHELLLKGEMVLDKTLIIAGDFLALLLYQDQMGDADQTTDLSVKIVEIENLRFNI